LAEKSTFFNSVTGDRKYKAEDIAAHFAKLITNGVYPAGTQLQVTEDAGMNVTVSAGSAWINGYAYHNSDNFTLVFDPADGVLNRIDRIVVRWSRLARSINLVVIKGTPASTPTAPAIVRNADYYDLGIATVAIGAGITAITQAMITDTRIDSTVCGLVSSLIRPDTSDWFVQFDSAFTAALTGNQADWDTWFANIKDVLDEETAGNLFNLISENTTNITALTQTVESHLNDYVSQMAFATASGTDTYAVVKEGIAALTEGLSIKVKFANANTGVSTLNINNIGAVAIKKGNGNDLAAGNIKAGQILHLVYTGTVFQLLGEGGEYGTAQVNDVLSGKTIGTEEGLVTGTMTNNGVKIITPGISEQALEGYYANGSKVAGDADLVAANILAGKNIFGVTGSAKRIATGTAVVSSSPYNVTVSGLSFYPRALLLIRVDYIKSSAYYNADVSTTSYVRTDGTNCVESTLDGSSVYVKQGAFKLNLTWREEGATFRWLAVE